MTTIIGISGSLRKGSLNGQLLAAAASLAPDGARIEIATIRGIPLYDGDLEAEQGVPEPVRELKERIAAASGLLLATRSRPAATSVALSSGNRYFADASPPRNAPASGGTAG